MSKLIARLRRDFPEYDYINAFYAAIPVYSVKLVLEVLKKQDLTTFQIYILEILALEVSSIDTISYYLGVDEEALNSSIASLLKLQYVELSSPLPGGENRLLTLAPKGRAVVEKREVLPVPTRKIGRFFFNALTESTISPSEDALYPDQIGKQGLFALPPKDTSRPTLGSFTVNDVKAVLSDEPAFKDTKIVELLKIKEITSCYFAPVNVVVLQHRINAEKTVAVYRNNTQQKPETEALQRLLETKSFEIPSIGVQLQRHYEDIQLPITSLESQIIDEIQQVMEDEYQREEIVIKVEENRILKSTTQDARERKELEEKIVKLQEVLADRDKNISILCEQLQQRNVEFLRTEQHRDKMIKALKEAKNEVIIISPWMNRIACDDKVCSLFADAILRGVRVRIGYHIGQERTSIEANNNRTNVNAVKSSIKKFVKKADPKAHETFLNDIVKTTGTHQKILVCDRQFAVTGSFNWLSYKGKVDDGYRQEISVVFCHSDPVNELAAIALKTWNSGRE